MSVIPSVEQKILTTLIMALEPENLSQDGELSPSETKEEEDRLNTEWLAVEARVGRTISVDEVWKMIEAD